MREIIGKVKANWIISMIYFLNLVLSLHYYLILYTNSSLLEGVLGNQALATLYSIGSIVSISVFLLTPRIVALMGIWTYLLIMTVGEGLTVLGLALTGNALLLGILFVIHQACSAMIFYSLDVYLEEATQLESKTGQLRGFYLTVSNIALVVSPLAAGFIIAQGGFMKLYLVSALLCIPLFMISYSALQGVSNHTPRHIRIKETLIGIWNNKNILNVCGAHMILQLFYAWMVIYIPIYLIDTLQFEWSEVGVLFTIMLLPFVLLEIPAGLISDKKTGEKEIMTAGFIISCIAVTMIPYLHQSFIAWAVVLFFSRVGASLVEITTESYFFKKVDGNDGDTISIFRMLRSLSYLITPFFVVTALRFIELQYVFWVLSLITLSGVYFSARIEDTL